ncbi:DNA repair protein RecN (Recombination protein N) [Riemerella columbipharyngis]|uniref:DNA repair protein RecN n=2 Tax=Riemerella columbipharyngis TaxID=1071918 RepID=A0A1G7CYT9_9FLAO|nr:DNA repair protein RecN (Recombination protein N) [Riemerella columbipharyngis]
MEKVGVFFEAVFSYLCLMLNRIFIQNFALIDTLDIHLNKGLQVITGETGAGKSIILGALRLILGERADIKSIANQDKKSVVEAEFVASERLTPFFDEHDLDFENPTIIRREILPSGKSRAFVNDVPVTLDVLKMLSSKLIDIHSQFETSQLFTDAFQFKMIDRLCDNKLIIEDYQKHFRVYKSLTKVLNSLREKLAQSNKESDYNNFLLQELEELPLEDLDWEELQNQLSIQENTEAIAENVNQILNSFYQEEYGVEPQLNDINNKLSKLASFSSAFEELYARWESAVLEMKDIVNEISNESDKISVNPEEIFILTEKINKINALFLKHQVHSIEELIDIRQNLETEKNSFDDLEAQIEETQATIERELAAMRELSETLHRHREEAAETFKAKIQALLSQLGLDKAKIEVKFTPSEDYNLYGKEDIEILFQANSGFPLKPIHSAISGGERSRVMLAIKKIMAENEELPTLILDEIDTGVSGRIAEEIGKVMREMSKDMQLIVITHLAQVAAKGSHHYKVIKEDYEGRTRSNIIPLSAEEKLKEIAQLISGSKITDAAIQQAKELMAKE